MTKHVLFLSLVVLALLPAACSPDAGNACAIEANFNKLASEHYQTHYKPEDLEPFDEFGKCVLLEAIKSHLDELNNREIKLIDSFYVRNYPFDDLGINFSFVSDGKGDFYLMHLPALHSYFYGSKYYKEAGNKLELRDSIKFSISKINSRLLDTFLRNEVFVSNDMTRDVQLAKHLLPVIFPNLLNYKMPLVEFMDSLRNQPDENYTYITNTLDTLINRNYHLSQTEEHYEIYHLPYRGFIFMSFYRDEEWNDLKLDLYFIPLKFRYAMRYEIERFKYAKCYE